MISEFGPRSWTKPESWSECQSVILMILIIIWSDSKKFQLNTQILKIVTSKMNCGLPFALASVSWSACASCIKTFLWADLHLQCCSMYQDVRSTIDVEKINRHDDTWWAIVYFCADLVCEMGSTTVIGLHEWSTKSGPKTMLLITVWSCLLGPPDTIFAFSQRCVTKLFIGRTCNQFCPIKFMTKDLWLILPYLREVLNRKTMQVWHNASNLLFADSMTWVEQHADIDLNRRMVVKNCERGAFSINHMLLIITWDY